MLVDITAQGKMNGRWAAAAIASAFSSLIGENDLLQSNNKTECNQMSLWSVMLQ